MLKFEVVVLVNRSLEGPRRSYCTPSLVTLAEHRAAPSYNTQGCNKHPGYGFEGMTPTHCSGHRLPGMVDRKRSRKGGAADARAKAIAVAAATAAAQEAAASAAAASAVAAARAVAAAGGGASGSVMLPPGLPMVGAPGAYENGATAAVGVQPSAAAAAGGPVPAVAVGTPQEQPPQMQLHHHHMTPMVTLPGFGGTSSTAPPSGLATRIRGSYQGIHAAIAASGAVGIDPGELRTSADGAPGFVPGDEFIDGRRRRGKKRPFLTDNCEFEQCMKGPSYALSGTPPRRCALHKIDGDVYVKSQCITTGCTKVSRGLFFFVRVGA